MLSVSRNQALINEKKVELAFLEYAVDKGYSLVDFDLIEHLSWKDLGPDDLQALGSAYHWTAADEVYVLRSDWTQTLVRYRRKYQMAVDRIAYSGPVYAARAPQQQFGLESFSAEVPTQQALLGDALQFCRDHGVKQIETAVVSHNKLLRHLASEDDLANPQIRHLIDERNRDGIADRLGREATLTRIMQEAPRDQLAWLDAELPELGHYIAELESWMTILSELGVRDVFADVLALPTQSYYRGVSLRCHAAKQDALDPLLSGGQYTMNGKAFGVAIAADHLAAAREGGLA